MLLSRERKGKSELKSLVASLSVTYKAPKFWNISIIDF